MRDKNVQTPKTFRVTFPDAHDISKFDPAVILMDYEWVLLKALYSTLVEYDAKGQIISGLAKKFYWEGSDLVFEMNDNIVTKDGYSVTAEDVLCSFNRLLMQSKNTHGKLNRILDLKKPGGLLENQEAMRIDGNKFILKAKRRTPFLLSLLTSADFVVIPKSSVDSSTLRITDYHNTTGPYYYEKKVDHEHILLNRNENHWYFHKDIPQNILIYSDSDGPERARSIDMFMEGKIDMIPFQNILMRHDFDVLNREVSGSQLFKTNHIGLTSLYFTKKGMLFPVEQRIYIAKLLQEAVKHNLTKPHYKPVNQFFPPSGHGGLDAERVERLSKAQTSAKATIDRKLVISVPESLKGFFQKILLLKNLDLEFISWRDSHFDYENVGIGSLDPDLILFGQDVSYEEDFSLLAYTLATNKFSLKGQDADSWLTSFIYEEDGKVRMEMIRALHFESLVTNPTVIPLYSLPYMAILQEGWIGEFPRAWLPSGFFHVKYRSRKNLSSLLGVFE